MEFQDLLAPLAGEFDVDEALSFWRWLVPGAMRPVVVSATGDLFMQDSDGAVFWLNTIAGTCEQVAASVGDWEAMLRDTEALERWFMPGFVAGLRNAAPLQKGECYSPTHPPILGAPWTVENWPPSPWEQHFRVMGSIHEQIKDLPDGTPITRIDWTKL